LSGSNSTLSSSRSASTVGTAIHPSWIASTSRSPMFLLAYAGVVGGIAVGVSLLGRARPE
jgi:hypothetical protein